MQYHTYLESAWWQSRRKEALKEASYKCQECGIKDKLHVHHLSYKNLYGEPSADLIALCADCHYNRHFRILDYDELLDLINSI